MLRRLTKGLTNRYSRYKLYYSNKDILDNNLQLKNKYEGQRCFIMGTGPSIKNQNLLLLRNEYTFVVNNFWKHDQFKKISPKFYAYIDPAGFQDGNKSNYWSELFLANSDLINQVPMTSFFHIKSKDFIAKNNLFKSHKIHYLATDGFFKDNLGFNMDLSKIIPNTKNVIAACIIIAVYMGFKEIYLLGCEHDFLAYPTNYEWSPHFYKNEDFDMKNPDDVKKFNLSVTTYESAINHAGKLFKNYRLLREKLAKENPSVRIYNSTPNSFLDVFPYMKFENINFKNE